MKNDSKKLFKTLRWDSKFFGYKVAQIQVSHLTSNNLRKLLSKLSSSSFKLVYWSVDPKDSISNTAAKTNRGFLADKKVTYLKDLSNYPKQNLNYQKLRSHLHRPLNKYLLSLALQAGFYSRFTRDKNFRHNEFTRLYTKWIERSIKGDISTDVIIYLEKNIERGLVTLELKSDHGIIGLIAVDKKSRGKGIGKKLVNAALSRFKDLGIKVVEATTQKANISACKFYEKLGFVEKDVQNVYHFWLNE